MAVVVVLVLLALWAAVLVPPIMRARGRGEQSMGGASGIVADLKATVFEGRRRSLAPSSLPTLMGPVGPPRSEIPEGPLPTNMSPQQKRRRDIFLGLLGAVSVTFVLAILASSTAFWLIQLLVDILLGAYVVLLLRFKAERTARMHSAAPASSSYAVASNALPSNVRTMNRSHSPQSAPITRGSTVIAFPRVAAAR